MLLAESWQRNLAAGLGDTVLSSRSRIKLNAHGLMRGVYVSGAFVCWGRRVGFFVCFS